jgi:hypothetical protein
MIDQYLTPELDEWIYTWIGYYGKFPQLRDWNMNNGAPFSLKQLYPAISINAFRRAYGYEELRPNLRHKAVFMLEGEYWRECFECSTSYPNTETYFYSKYSHMHQCKECKRASAKTSRANYKNKFVLRYKDNASCAHCGFSKTTAPSFYKDSWHVALQFDHLKDKRANVADLVKNINTSWDCIDREIKKGQWLCANCHSVKTHQNRDTVNNQTESIDIIFKRNYNDYMD